MRLDLRYRGRSGLRGEGAAATLAFAPNLARPRVSFDAGLKAPVRFREAVSALHDVVVGDLRFHAKDRSAYRAWLERQREQEESLRKATHEVAKQQELARARAPMPANLERDFHRMHRLYWGARRTWARELSETDPELFRHLVPCDPVVTVAPDVVFFECFAKDESSYGCLSVDRDAFDGEAGAELGTTNVDYSLQLYDHFQTLRSYRETRLLVDPHGFEVHVAGSGDAREEKIDLPSSWLRGFGQISAAMGLPARKVELSVDTVYSILAFLKRHREKAGPRSLRFQLVPGKPATVAIEPWGVTVGGHGPAWDGAEPEELKVWGRRRLFALARVLPLADRIEVLLLGSGLPSVWIAHLGDMRLTLALSGWTANDWTGSLGLELLAGDVAPDAETTAYLDRYLEKNPRADAATLCQATGAKPEVLLASLLQLARQGQVVYDHAARCWRRRQVMPVALSEAVLGPEHPELVEGRQLFRGGRVELSAQEDLGGGKRHLRAQVERVECEAILDADGGFRRAKCGCSFFRAGRLRTGPCRHLIALRLAVQASPAARGTTVARGPAAGSTEGVRRPVALEVDADVLAVVALEADRLERSLSWVVLQAFELSGPRLAKSPDGKHVRRPRPPRRTETLKVHVPAGTLEALEKEARRLSVSLPELFEAAWALARPTISQMQSGIH